MKPTRPRFCRRKNWKNFPTNKTKMIHFLYHHWIIISLDFFFLLCLPESKTESFSKHFVSWKKSSSSSSSFSKQETKWWMHFFCNNVCGWWHCVIIEVQNSLNSIECMYGWFFLLFAFYFYFYFYFSFSFSINFFSHFYSSNFRCIDVTYLLLLLLLLAIIISSFIFGFKFVHP